MHGKQQKMPILSLQITTHSPTKISKNGKPTLATCNEVVRIDFGIADYEVWYTYLPGDQ